MEGHAKKIYFWLHVALVACGLSFPALEMLASHIPKVFSGCWVHDFLFLYCPLCGGTRACRALLHLDLVSALRYHAAVVALVLFLIGWDIACMVRLLRKKERWWYLPTKCWIIITVIFLGFAVLRNLGMIFLGYDSIGELVYFWKG